MIIHYLIKVVLFLYSVTISSCQWTTLYVLNDTIPQSIYDLNLTAADNLVVDMYYDYGSSANGGVMYLFNPGTDLNQNASYVAISSLVNTTNARLNYTTPTTKTYYLRISTTLYYDYSYILTITINGVVTGRYSKFMYVPLVYTKMFFPVITPLGGCTLKVSYYGTVATTSTVASCYGCGSSADSVTLNSSVSEATYNVVNNYTSTYTSSVILNYATGSPTPTTFAKVSVVVSTLNTAPCINACENGIFFPYTNTRCLCPDGRIVVFPAKCSINCSNIAHATGSDGNFSCFC